MTAEKTYTCGRCGGVFDKGCPDDDAMAESRAVFGDIPAGELAAVCEDCWQEIRPRTIPVQLLYGMSIRINSAVPKGEPALLWSPHTGSSAEVHDQEDLERIRKALTDLVALSAACTCGEDGADRPSLPHKTWCPKYGE
jgi:hypothetical protein